MFYNCRKVLEVSRNYQFDLDWLFIYSATLKRFTTVLCLKYLNFSTIKLTCMLYTLNSILFIKSTFFHLLFHANLLCYRWKNKTIWWFEREIRSWLSYSPDVSWFKVSMWQLTSEQTTKILYRFNSLSKESW